MFKSVGSLIKTTKHGGRPPDVFLALQVRQVAQESLKIICADLPVEVVASSKIVSFKNGVLMIKASGLLSAELQARSGGLIREINKVFGKKIVHRIRFKAG